jgi:hypothetical protein
MFRCPEIPQTIFIYFVILQPAMIFLLFIRLSHGSEGNKKKYALSIPASIVYAWSPESGGMRRSWMY